MDRRRRDAFSAEGRTPDEQPWFDHIQGLLRIRNVYPRAFQGGMEHFPKRGVYGFSREQDDVRIVILVNAAAEERELPWANLAPWLADAIAVEALQPDGTLAPVFPATATPSFVGPPRVGDSQMTLWGVLGL